MIEKTIDGQVARFYLENCGDGGQIVVCLVQTSTTNEWTSYRHWYNDPKLAQSVFNGMGDDGEKYRVGEAMKNNVTGKLSRE